MTTFTSFHHHRLPPCPDFRCNMADEDDLYADLYAEDVGAGVAGKGGGGSVQFSYEGGDENDSHGGNGNAASRTGGQTNTVSTSKSSFIPPPPQSTSTGSASSFIPPTSSSSMPSKPVGGSGSSFIPSATNMRASLPRAPIETAPMTNTDNNRASIISSQGAERPILPHEMPDEG